jgi:hypothetical protein
MYMGLMILGRQTEIHTARPLEPESIAFEVAMAIEKLKKKHTHTNHQVLIKSQPN